MVLGIVSQHPFKGLLKGNDSGVSSFKMGLWKWKHVWKPCYELLRFQNEGCFLWECDSQGWRLAQYTCPESFSRSLAPCFSFGRCAMLSSGGSHHNSCLQGWVSQVFLMRVLPLLIQVIGHMSQAGPVRTEHFLELLGKKCCLPGDTC